MGIIDAALLGVVEGLTEFLPISSTGHLVLVAHILRLPATEFLKSFEIIIQLGAILAVVTLYWRRLLFDRLMMQRIIIALVPALGVGFLFYVTIRHLLSSPHIIIAALFLGGLFLIFFERARRFSDGTETLDTLTNRQALYIGFAQALSVIPGVSRAGATIVGGLLVRLNRSAAVEFSFLLGVPTMIAATTLDLTKNYHSFTLANTQLLAIGFTVSFFVALLAIKLLLRFVKTHSFVAFGVYRIVAALFFALFIL